MHDWKDIVVGIIGLAAVFRLLLAMYYAAKRRYMRDLMNDLTNGDRDGKQSR
jgi:hypothetical protein